MIGIHSISTCHNYGALLQCWSLQSAVRTISERPAIHIEYSNISLFRMVKSAIRKSFEKKVSDEIAMRRKTASIFKISHLPSLSISNWEYINRTKIRTILVGSDEVLNPSKHTTSLMRGVIPDSLAVPVSGYAMSSGRSDFSKTLEAGFNPYGYRMVGVRDTQAAQFFTSQGRDAELTLDPVFLPEHSDFIDLGKPLITSSQSHLPEKPYFLAYTDMPRKELCPLVDALDIDEHVVVLGNMEGSKNANDCHHNSRVSFLPHDYPIHVIPELFSNATAVITTFFHGVVFSLRNTKPFLFHTNAMKQYKVFDLLQQLGVDYEKDLSGVSLLDHATWSKLYDRICPVLSKRRQQSLEYLAKAIEVD